MLTGLNRSTTMKNFPQMNFTSAMSVFGQSRTREGYGRTPHPLLAPPIPSSHPLPAPPTLSSHAHPLPAPPPRTTSAENIPGKHTRRVCFPRRWCEGVPYLGGGCPIPYHTMVLYPRTYIIPGCILYHTAYNIRYDTHTIPIGGNHFEKIFPRILRALRLCSSFGPIRTKPNTGRSWSATTNRRHFVGSAATYASSTQSLFRL